MLDLWNSTKYPGLCNSEFNNPCLSGLLFHIPDVEPDFAGSNAAESTTPRVPGCLHGDLPTLHLRSEQGRRGCRASLGKARTALGMGREEGRRAPKDPSTFHIFSPVLLTLPLSPHGRRTGPEAIRGAESACTSHCRRARPAGVPGERPAGARPSLPPHRGAGGTARARALLGEARAALGGGAAWATPDVSVWRRPGRQQTQLSRDGGGVVAAEPGAGRRGEV